MSDPVHQPLPGEKQPVRSILVVAIMFLGGGAAGVGLAQLLAPDSPVAQFVAFLALPVSFAAAITLWQGFTLLVLLFRLVVGAGRGRIPPQDALAILRRKAALMIPVPPIVCAPTGLIVGLLGKSMLAGVGVFTAAGLLYGLGLYALAQKDLLPLMEPT